MVATEDATHVSSRGDGRERILDVARDLFLAKGFAATSMQEIADAVGMTKPALYYHFRDKQDLLLAVLGREMEEGQRAFFATVTAEPTLRRRLEQGASWTFSRIQGDLGRLMSDMHRVLPADRVHEFKCSHPMPVDLVKQILVDAKASGELGCEEDMDVLARLYVGMIFGQLAMQNSEEIQRLDANRLGKIVARIFMDGVCRPPTVDAA
jgi:AcrR family transcriptional regulator